MTARLNDEVGQGMTNKKVKSGSNACRALIIITRGFNPGKKTKKNNRPRGSLV